ncbi:MAG: hypothetical protein QM725_12210 [Lacibacter sp.]
MNYKVLFQTVVGWISGILFSLIGLINIFWGNDPEFGVFLFALSSVFYPPFNVLFRKVTGRSIPLIAKIILALFILWTSLGVGELFDKIGMMLKSF